MFFPISGAQISPIYLAVVGFIIGILGGFFGVGGSFIAGPALRAVGLDWNFAVGTDLAHIVGKSVVAAKRHRALGNVDLKLGLIMALGTIGARKSGAQLIQVLKRTGQVNLVVSIVSIVIYVSISIFMVWESRKTLKSRQGQNGRGPRAIIPRFAISRCAFSGCGCIPMVSLPDIWHQVDFDLGHFVSRIRRRIFQRFSRWRRGLHPNAIDGLRAGNSDAPRGRDRFVRDRDFRQLRNVLSRDEGQRRYPDRAGDAYRRGHRRADRSHQTQYFAGPKIRLAFVPLPLIGAAIVIYTLITGTNCNAR